MFDSQLISQTEDAKFPDTVAVSYNDFHKKVPRNKLIKNYWYVVKDGSTCNTGMCIDFILYLFSYFLVNSYGYQEMIY